VSIYNYLDPQKAETRGEEKRIHECWISQLPQPRKGRHWVDLLLKAQEFHAMRANGNRSDAAGNVKIIYKIELEMQCCNSYKSSRARMGGWWLLTGNRNRQAEDWLNNSSQMVRFTLKTVLWSYYQKRNELKTPKTTKTRSRIRSERRHVRQ
jgi:hypothetical protein